LMVQRNMERMQNMEMAGDASGMTDYHRRIKYARDATKNILAMPYSASNLVSAGDVIAAIEESRSDLGVYSWNDYVCSAIQGIDMLSKGASVDSLYVGDGKNRMEKANNAKASKILFQDIKRRAAKAYEKFEWALGKIESDEGVRGTGIMF